MNIRTFSLCLPAVCALLAAPGAFAQDAVSNEATQEIQVDRDARVLKDQIDAARRHDVDTTDTALVFTNNGRMRARILCLGFDHNGNTVGRAVTALPKLGLRYILASDLSMGADFIGSVQCSSPGHVTGSAVFLAPGAITALQVKQGEHAGQIRIRFPVVASY